MCNAINPLNNPNLGGASISIALSLSTGLGVGQPGAQAYAGPQGSFAQGGCVGPGGFGGLSGCGCGPNPNALANNLGGGPQNAFQAGFQQGMMAAKMRKLRRKLHRLMAQMGGAPGMSGPGFGGPGFGTPGFGGPGFPGAFGAIPGTFPGRLF